MASLSFCRSEGQRPHQSRVDVQVCLSRSEREQELYYTILISSAVKDLYAPRSAQRS